MNIVNEKDIFEKYYQKEYDFNTTSLSEDEIDDIKRLVSEKRVDYALAPIGEQIFSFIIAQNQNIRVQIIDFDTEKVDGMLYIPQNGREKAHIILNGNKPLINQIFAAAHEYYHYIKDYESIKSQPYICNFSTLQSVNEKKASRFAAELLLPEEALRREVRILIKQFDANIKKKLGYQVFAVISILLTIKYQLPLKAVIYRLYEEGIIDEIDWYIQNYDVIKCVLLQINVMKDKIDHLYSNENNLVNNYTIIYQQMEKVYKSGYASREEILKDAQRLQLNIEIIESFFETFNDSDDDEDDSDIISMIKSKLEVK